MSNRKFFWLTALFLLLALGIGGGVALMTTKVPPLKVGVVRGPHAEILEQVQAVAARDGLHVDIVYFDDYLKINEALAKEKLDANLFQPAPYLELVNKDRGFRLAPAARTILFPLGFYSRKITDLAALPQGAVVALPQDPLSLGRSLLLLHKAGLISLRPDRPASPNLADIAANPRELVFKTAEASSLPRHLEDAHLLAVASGYAFSYGLLPRTALLLEDSSSPYAHVLAVRQEDADSRSLQLLVKAYHSPEVRQYIEERYQGTVLPAW